jgi:hypothetical protein
LNAFEGILRNPYALKIPLMICIVDHLKFEVNCTVNVSTYQQMNINGNTYSRRRHIAIHRRKNKMLTRPTVFNSSRNVLSPIPACFSSCTMARATVKGRREAPEDFFLFNLSACGRRGSKDGAHQHTWVLEDKQG